MYGLFTSERYFEFGKYVAEEDTYMRSTSKCCPQNFMVGVKVGIANVPIWDSRAVQIYTDIICYVFTAAIYITLRNE